MLIRTELIRNCITPMRFPCNGMKLTGEEISLDEIYPSLHCLLSVDKTIMVMKMMNGFALMWLSFPSCRSLLLSHISTIVFEVSLNWGIYFMMVVVVIVMMLIRYISTRCANGIASKYWAPFFIIKIKKSFQLSEVLLLYQLHLAMFAHFKNSSNTFCSYVIFFFWIPGRK